MTKSIPVRLLRPDLPSVLDEIKERFTRFVVTRNGMPAALLIHPDDFEGLMETLDILSDPITSKRVKRGIKEVREGKGGQSLEAFLTSLDRV